MPLFGAHLSVAGGLHNAISAAVALKCEALQIFTKNANTWIASPILESVLASFRNAANTANLKEISAHDSYLINIASPDDQLFTKSVSALVTEMERAEALGLRYLVMHPGAHVGSGEDVGIKRVVDGLNEVLSRCSGFRVRLLIETTAGQGTTLGHRFEQIAEMINRSKWTDRLGVCFDTCHVFAAGYPFSTTSDYNTTIQQFDDVIGLARLHLFHLNDSAKPFGSRVDRHAGIGLGEIGIEPFRRLTNDQRFRNHPMILETPKHDKDGMEMDPVNLTILRGLVREKFSRD